MKGSIKKELEECYHIAANIVNQYGEKYLPIFKRLHAECENRKADSEMLRLATKMTKG